MSNVSQNLLNIVLQPIELDAIIESLNDVETALPAGTLTDDQRASYGAINVDNRNFVDDVISEMSTNQATVTPAFFDPAFISNDLTLYDQAEMIETRLNQVLQKISDIKRIAGHEGYGFALGIYAFYQMAAKIGMPGAQASYDKLKARFEGQGKNPAPYNP